MGLLKSQKRSKWYKCFRPESHEDFPFEPVPCLKNGGKESNINVLRDNFLMALYDDKLESRFSDKKSKSRRSLSRAFRVVLFPITAAKKSQSRKTEQEKSFRSQSSGSTSSSSKLGKMFKSFRGSKKSSSSSLTQSVYKDSLDCGLQNDLSSSNASSIFSSNSVTPASSLTSSTRNSSIASHSRSPSERKKSIELDLKQLEKNTISSAVPKRSNTANIGLCFLLVCLVALVLCGKALAVFCTSTCLFLVPSRLNKVVDHHQFPPVQNDGTVVVFDSIDFDSDEYKKKVIMEGLLERNHVNRAL